MSKPIKLTDDIIAAIQQEFIENVKKMKMFDGKLNYVKNFQWKDSERATIVFSPLAFTKMLMLVNSFDSEVAWHGVAYRDEEHSHMFHITDILIYPQVVSGSTVNTDQEAYQSWLYTHDDDVFNNIRMQGHSHVNMPTSPSAVDLTHQEKILSQVDDDMFYIFMIWNKKFSHNLKIFDMKYNTLYETEDIDMYIGDADCNFDAFVKEAKDMVKTKSYGYYGNTYGNQYYGGAHQYNKQQPAAKTNTQSKDKGKTKAVGSRGNKYDFGDYEDFYGDGMQVY